MRFYEPALPAYGSSENWEISDEAKPLEAIYRDLDRQFGPFFTLGARRFTLRRRACLTHRSAPLDLLSIVPCSYVSPIHTPLEAVMSYTKSSTVRYRITNFQANRVEDATPDSTNHKISICGRSMTGEVLPKWRKIIASSGNATTPFNADETLVQADYVENRVSLYWHSAFEPQKWIHFRHRESSYANWYVLDPLAHFSILTAPFFAVAEDRAIKSLYRAIWQAHHQVQGGVILGELGKTARMLAGTASGLKSGVFNYLAKAVGIRRGKGTDTNKRKQIANSYLEAVFGWQPLIMDCKDLAKTIGRLCHEADRVRFRGFGQNVGQAAQSVGGLPMGANSCTIDTGEVLVVYSGFLRGPKHEAGSPPAERIVSMSGFDLRSFIPTVWELVPYSFLVDYFTNVGDVLQALCTDTSGVTGLWRTNIWTSQRDINIAPDKAKCESLIRTQYSGAGEAIKDLAISGRTGGFTLKRRNVSRYATGMPLMVPQFTGFDLPYKQFANIGALLLSKMS